MELVDRYLRAVAFWLPRKERADILAELAEDLRSQVEEKEAELGHRLSESELEALLKRRGHPVAVANRFLPQRYLIGPALFPIYRRVLIIVGLCYLIPWVLVALGLITFSPAFRVETVQAGWLHGVYSLWSSWCSAAFIAVGAVTIVFAALESAHASAHFLEKWEPRKLPAARDRNRIPRSASIMELAVLLTFSVWWIGHMGSPVLIDRPGLRIVLSPLWPYFFKSFGLLLLVSLVLSAVNLMRPYWTRPRAASRLAINLAGSSLFCWMLKAHILAEIAAARVPSAQTLRITNAINLWAERAFPIFVLWAIVMLVIDVYRIVRRKATGTDIRQQTVAAL
jgi:hypothetical protein